MQSTLTHRIGLVAAAVALACGVAFAAPGEGFTMPAAFAPTFNVTKLFLDRAEVQKRIGQARARALSRQGAYVRQRVITKVLRRRKSVSRPGQPPHVHSRQRGLKTVLFYYDTKSDSVVVGPVKLNQVNQTTTGRMTVPQLLEFGGTGLVHEIQSPYSGVWYRRDARRRIRPGTRRRVRRARYAPRPFMSVALEEEIAEGTIEKSWQNVLRG